MILWQLLASCNTTENSLRVRTSLAYFLDTEIEDSFLSWAIINKAYVHCITNYHVYIKLDVPYLSWFKIERSQVTFLAVPMLKQCTENGLGSNSPSFPNCGHDNHLVKDKLYSIVLFRGIILTLCDIVWYNKLMENNTVQQLVLSSTCTAEF